MLHRDGRAAAEGERDKWRDECANVNRDLLALRIAAAPAASSGGGGGGSSGDSIETKLLRDKNASLEVSETDTIHDAFTYG
jgi:hypothetical protein